MERKEILKNFQVESDIVSVEPYGSGHINHTYLVTAVSGKKYILQGINTSIFKNTKELMENVLGVTSYLRKEIEKNGGNPERETLTVVLTDDEKSYYTDAEGNAWRVYIFIEDAVTFDQVESKEDFYESGRAFGNFQAMLADYPADTLHETIPDFHNTAKRYLDFEKAVEKDVCGRVAEVAEEIAFVRQRKDEMSVLHELLAKGELPLRVTHNDTKLNNIMLDPKSHKAVCVIDLDTVMPGLSVHDFGDAIRFGANTAAEDEIDASKASLSLELFEIYVKGFLEGCNNRLTEKEVEMLPMGAKMMTLECGMRFLTDYLSGDTYFKTTREKHNLDRCRTQFALVADMEKKWQKMCEICIK
ncbi:MAG: aminoglycoside phosphotransferase family protein [Lachnospiraceae bacterium]|nr:aminoglycoside phosphotransferase family protein [Lachnospiraceae bacterium]